MKTTFEEYLVCKRDEDFVPLRHSIRAEAESVGPIEDFPASTLRVISERAWRTIERLYPGNTDFHPIAVSFKSEAVEGSFGLLRIKHHLDCIDRSKSGEPTMVTPPWGDLYLKYAIDPAKVPASVGLFKVKHGLVNVFVRGDLAAALNAEGYTGWAWGPAWNGQ